jgi:hypothetical protein
MKELYTTGVPLPFDCVYACIVEDNAATEKAMHTKFARQRLNPRREFFELKASQIVKAAKQFELADITPSFREDFDSQLTEEERGARRKARRKLEQADPTVAEAKGLHASIAKPQHQSVSDASK